MNGERIAGQARNDKLVVIPDQGVVIPDLIRDPFGAGEDPQGRWMAGQAQWKADPA
jgi:hypothetical protein